MKTANGIARMDIQRHGNCTKRSLGSASHKILLIRSIRNAAVTESATNVPQRLFFGGCAFDRVRGKLSAANMAVNAIIRIALLEAMRLKALCSASAITAYKKFCDGCKPDARAKEIFTQRRSYAAGPREKPARPKPNASAAVPCSNGLHDFLVTTAHTNSA